MLHSNLDALEFLLKLTDKLFQIFSQRKEGHKHKQACSP